MRAAVLWTGGKDSALACYKAHRAGYEVTALLTFVPPNAEFLAHPIFFMKLQAEAMGISHHESVVVEPLDDSYEKTIVSFRDKHKIDALVTGDIAEVDGQPNWIRQRCLNTGIKVLTPLWGMDRNKIMSDLFSEGFKIVISAIKKGFLGGEWLGRQLNKEALDELRAISGKTGLDICGEQGEYHTLVMDGPMFRKYITIGNYSKHANDAVMYIEPSDVRLNKKV